MDIDSFKNIVSSFGLAVSTNEYDKLKRLASQLLEANKITNLTAIRDEESVWQKHFIDSLSCAVAYDFNMKNIIDVGSGAGFPALPLAIFFPNSNFICLEATGKKVDFINNVAQDLGLENIKAIKARAEEAAHNEDLREFFDVCASRAVAQTAVLAELCLAFVKTGGVFISQKAGFAAEEISNGAKAVKAMGGCFLKQLDVDICGEERLLVIYEKVSPTPAKYPRRDGIPAKEPIK